MGPKHLPVDRETPEARDVIMKLGAMIDAAIPGAGPKPELLGRLPVEDLEPRTVRFFHTVISLNSFYFMSNINILNLSPETRVVMARYDKDSARGTLILVEYLWSSRPRAAPKLAFGWCRRPNVREGGVIP